MKVKNPNLQWRRFIKYPLQKWSGYITEPKGVYKIMEIRLGRHFSYVNMCKVNKDTTLGRTVYITGIGNSWEDTITRLTTNIGSYVSNKVDH